MDESMKCPKCGEECWREEADVGVGIIYGPWGCQCGWSESEMYDLSKGRNPIDEKGGYLDQYGVYYPPGNPVAIAMRSTKDPAHDQP